ncbi:MAG: hypothetical protein IT288_07735 [Bdellovibrionales bacterium]|nr:hypothetical protein [Bdellovibrionales bacterium]
MMTLARSRFHFLILVLAFSLPFSISYAAITVESVTGASNWLKSGGTVIIYGGFAGSESTGCTANGDGTCNNCSTSLLACNEKRVMLASELQVSVKSDSAETTGPVILTTSDGNTQIGTDGDRVGKNTIGTVKLSWSTLCSAALSTGAAASCATTTSPSAVATLKVGVDEDDNGQLSSSEGDTIQVKVHLPVSADTIEHCDDPAGTFTDGVCAFTAFPGDEKVYIEDIDPTTTFPNSGNIQFSHARFFYSTVGFTSGADGPNPGSDFGHVDIPIETQGDEYFLSKNNISDLSNDSYYFFRISMLDQAGNVSFITSDTAIQFACGAAASALGPNPTDDANCPFIAHPDEVVGLLSEDVNCFIATAAYGSSLDQHLKTFRAFRSKVLLPTKWGKALVRKYYQLGPYASRWLNDHSWLKPLVRLLLWPLWAWTAVALKFGGGLASLGLLMSFLVMMLIVRQLLSWRRRRDLAS